MRMSPGNSDTLSGTAAVRGIFRQECFFWGSAAVLLLIFLCAPELGKDEVSRLESAREMLLTGNILQVFSNWQSVSGIHPAGVWFLFPFIEIF